MAGPYANYSIVIVNKILSTTSESINTFHAPNVLKSGFGILQVEIQTEGTSGLKAVIRINGKNVFSYGPSSTNLTRVLQTIIPSDTLNLKNNMITGEVVAGSGTLRVRNLAIWWQAE